jgi:hypothetical protein
LLPPLLIYLIYVAKVNVRRQLATIGFCVLGVAGYVSWLTPYSAAVLSGDYTPVSQPVNLLFQEFSPAGAIISVGMVCLTLMYALTWVFAKRSEIVTTLLPVFLIYYTFTDPRPQYFLWCLPFLIIEIVYLKRRHLRLLTALLAFVLSNWFFTSMAFDTPSGYSFLLFPLEGANLPWYSIAIVQFVNSTARSLLFIPFLSAGTFIISLIYAFEIVRHWPSSWHNNGNRDDGTSLR